MAALSVQPVLSQCRLVRSSFAARLPSFGEERRRSQFRLEQRAVKCDWWCGDRSSQEQENALPAPSGACVWSTLAASLSNTQFDQLEPDSIPASALTVGI